MAELPAGPRRLAVVGVSEGPTCGVRDHATLLCEGLQREGVACSMHWLMRSEPSARGARAQFASWTRALPGEIAAGGAQGVLLHYSVFAWSYRGVPVFVWPAVSALQRTRLPVIGLLHEFVYPWRRGGARGTAWALSQRAVLGRLVRASSGLIVTTDRGARWLDTRIWLARRPVAVAPVFSNLPSPSGGIEPARALVGLFGYAYDGAAVELVLDALVLLRAQVPQARLLLLGAPGPDSAAGRAWRAGARARGIEQAVSFSGVLAAQQLADALASCQVLLHAEPAGPTSRKGTLAGSLAAGRPVVAIDGPRRWQELVAEQAALVLPPSPDALAAGIGELLCEQERREALGVRGGAFARERMSVARSARTVVEMLDRLGVQT